MDYIIDDIKSHRILGAYYMNYEVSDSLQIPLLFTHGGISPEFYQYMQKHTNINTVISDTMDINLGSRRAEYIANYTRDELVNTINNHCKPEVKFNNFKFPKCEFNSVVYAAGRERGGGPIGGPFWSGIHSCVLVILYISLFHCIYLYI